MCVYVNVYVSECVILAFCIAPFLILIKFQHPFCSSLIQLPIDVAIQPKIELKWNKASRLSILVALDSTIYIIRALPGFKGRVILKKIDA